jgi:hypothetical protein
MVLTNVNGELVIPTEYQSDDDDGDEPDNIKDGHDGENA